MGETRVDLVHLLEDLADAYPGDLEETVLTEIVANSLDSGASTVAIVTDPACASFTVIDNGQGMRRAELRRYHDVAASAKVRGDGIGFAGVGIKLGLLVSEDVVTESRRGKDHVATTWALASRKRAPWQWSPPLGLVADRGTAVRLRLRNALSPLLDAGYLETILREHFEPLFDPYFDDILRAHYPEGIRFLVNGQTIDRIPIDRQGGESAAIAVRLARRRKPSAVGYLLRQSDAFANTRHGIGISTLGKVIKRGWDWLGISPAAPERISGLIEVPELASCLTLNKVDFLRAGPRGASYMAYRKAMQEAVADRLAEWGDTPADPDQGRRRAARPVERDLESILVDLADDFPLLAMLVDRRAGGRRKLPAANGPSDRGRTGLESMDLFAMHAEPERLDADGPDNASPDEPTQNDESVAADANNEPSAGLSPPAPDLPSATLPSADLPSRGHGRRPVRLGLTIQFESRPDERELGRLVETTVWVNEGHAAYVRAVASRSEGYHLALSVAMALAEVAVEPANERAFVTEFMARWGESAGQRGGTRPNAKRKRKRPR